MSSHNVDLSYQLTDGFAARFIRYKVASLFNRTLIHRMDCEDLEQELKLLLVRRFSKFDPTVAHWNAFVVTVIERYLLTFLMTRRRRRMQSTSLDEIAHQAIHALGDFRITTCCTQPPGYRFLDPTEQWDLILDVQDILSHLPEKTQRLCERLMNHSLSEVARQMQMPRRTLRGHISMLRNGFASARENN